MVVVLARVSPCLRPHLATKANLPGVHAQLWKMIREKDWMLIRVIIWVIVEQDWMILQKDHMVVRMMSEQHRMVSEQDWVIVERDWVITRMIIEKD